MNDTKYLRPQILDAIPLNKHAVIEASAGTGKTFTIENLVVEILLKTDATIDEILVVTFTEKATGELRKRIRATLESVVHGSTAMEADANGGLVGEKTEKATDEMRRRIRATPESTPQLSFEMSVADIGFVDEERKIREALFSFDRASIHTIHSFCHRMLSELSFQSGMLFNLDVVDKLSAFHEAFRAELREHIANDASAKKLLGEWIDAHERDAMNSLEQLLLAAHQRRYLETGESVRNASLSPAARQALALKARVVDGFLPQIGARMDRVKRERGALDYDDMLEWLARALDDSYGDALAAALRERYRFALIDEFQDTDDLQWKIFRRLFVEGKGPSVVHIIGDPKQAIYSFRGADVFTYLGARRELTTTGATFVPLIENFRSTAKLIDALNEVLRQDAPAPFFSGAIRYDHPVTCGRQDLKAELKALDAPSEPAKPVTLMNLTTSAPVSAKRARTAIARHIARTIAGLLKNKSLRVTGNRGQLDSVTAKNIFVLTRTNPESVTVGKYLREAGVPFAFYKQEGLFQTRESGDILDALKAAQEPNVHSRRLKAWATPFFGVSHDDLPRTADLPPAHPLLERLYQWNALASAQRFAELFDAMLHGSGLVDRELFLSNSAREVTNYLHIFEILLEKAVTQKLGLGELIELLADYIAERAMPGGDDSDVQRLESERDAVQVMTIHRSKGLEADVVFLFGGTHRGYVPDNAIVFHDGNERRVAIGKEEQDAHKPEILTEQTEEEKRLLYVAITRARAKLYLPLFPNKSTKMVLSGGYKHLNDRLNVIAKSIECETTQSDLFEIEAVSEFDNALTDSEIHKGILKNWNPPEILLDDSTEHDAQKTFATLNKRHSPLETRSYTTLQRKRELSKLVDLEPEDFRVGVDAIDARSDIPNLPGGRDVGVFLHEVIEKLDFETFSAVPNRNAWVARDDVRELFVSTMRRHGVKDPRWLDHGREIVFNSLTSPVALGGTLLENGLFQLPKVREMEFAYPIPETHHRLLDNEGDGAWTVERGYLKGIIDLVFQHEQLIYFADWKSDLLPSYKPEAVARHVERHYSLQARIYSIGIVRLLNIRSERDYNSGFGGLLYVFLRGVAPSGDGKAGLYFIRPPWSEMVSYESELVQSRTERKIDP